MNVFIIGASGLVGGNCMKYFNSIKEYNVAGSHYSTRTSNTVFFDTLKPENPANFNLEKFNPDAVIHCGALTHVDYCEQHPDESFEKTVISTRNVIGLCKKLNSRLVYISSDYVFDGISGPYDETAPANPISVYGKHKSEAENLIISRLDRHLIIRITNVYGEEERKKNFISHIAGKAAAQQTDTPLRLKLPFDQYATPVNAFDVARAIYLLLKDKKRGVYHLAGTDYLNRCQLAHRILGFFPGVNYSIEALSTKELIQPAPRPLQGGLKTGKFHSEYPGFIFSNVDDFLKSII